MSCSSTGASKVSYRTVPVAWTALLYSWRSQPSSAFLRGPNSLLYIQATHCTGAYTHTAGSKDVPSYQQIRRRLLTRTHQVVEAQSLLGVIVRP